MRRTEILRISMLIVPAVLSARTFCTFVREISPIGCDGPRMKVKRRVPRRSSFVLRVSLLLDERLILSGMGRSTPVLAGIRGFERRVQPALPTFVLISFMTQPL